MSDEEKILEFEAVRENEAAIGYFGNEIEDKNRIPRDILLSSVTKNRKRLEGEGDEQYLGKITHVNLSNKGLTTMKGLELCKKLQTLYLYENSIQSLTPLTFAKGLTHLYLQHNSLQTFQGLGNLPLLTKLYADYNKIENVSDLVSQSFIFNSLYQSFLFQKEIDNTTISIP